MVRLLVAVLALAAGCYSPSVVAGSPCSTNEDCPRELTCVAQHCGGSPSPIDAAADSAVNEVPVDSSPVVVDAPPDALVPNVWTSPTPVPGVNTSSIETDPSYTPDRLTIVFASTRLNGTEDIFIGTRASTAASFTVSPIDAINTLLADEHSPEISADGNTLYFTSDRGSPNNFDVYVTTKAGSTWAAPTLVTQLSSTSNDNDVAISPDGLAAVTVRGTSFYGAIRATVTSAWSPEVLLGSTVFGTQPSSPSIDAAGDIYLHAGVGARDLFIARRNGNSFSPAVPITELNTNVREAAPFISADEKHLVFDRGNDIYESTHP